MNAFQLPSRPSVMNCREVKQAHARSQTYRNAPDYLKPRNRGNFLIDPDSEASANKRRALVRGGI